MGEYTEIILGVFMFTAMVLALVAVILSARAKLVSSGEVTIECHSGNLLVIQGNFVLPHD